MSDRTQLRTRALSRRSFLVGTGGFGVVIAFASSAEAASFAGPMVPHIAGSKTQEINAWVSIGTDGVVTIVSPGSEMGQGTMTAMPVLIAEDMDADWTKVRVVQSPSDAKNYGNPVLGGFQGTFGSYTTTGYYEKLRLVGAQTRLVLLAMAAEAWKVPADQLSTEPGLVLHKASNRKIGYGALAGMPLPAVLPQATTANLKPLAACRYIGQDLARVDVPSKVNGTAKYGMDTELPNMIYAAVLRPSVQGEAPASVDDSAALKIPGVTRVISLPYGVAVLGETVEATKKGKSKLKVVWTKTAKARSYNSDAISHEYRTIADDHAQKGVAMLTAGDAPAAIAGAARAMSATFTSDHVAHTCMEPLNATARVTGDTVEIWTSTQSPQAVQLAGAQVAGTTPDKVVVHVPMLGGGFGRRTEVDFAIDAILLAKASAGKPVKVIWSREDDVQNDKYRPLEAQRIDVGLDANGNIVGWQHRIVAESYFARTQPGVYAKTGGKDVVVAGDGNFRYKVPAQLVEFVRASRGVDIGSWRSVSAGYTKFAIESMIDELAAQKGVDPVTYRRELLVDQPRAVAVIDAAVKMSNWPHAEPGRALGIAYSDGLGAHTATVVETSLDAASGKIGVHKVWCAIDPGVAVQPRNIIAQTEGCVVFGLGAALREQINIQDGEVQESNFGEYRVMRMSDIPEIEVQVISTDNKPTGVAEAGVAPMGAAIANAVARLPNGPRLRQLPMLPERVKAAMAAKA